MGLPTEFGGGFEDRSSSSVGGPFGATGKAGSRVNVVTTYNCGDYLEKTSSFWFEHINGFTWVRPVHTNLCLVTGSYKA